MITFLGRAKMSGRMSGKEEFLCDFYFSRLNAILDVSRKVFKLELEECLEDLILRLKKYFCHRKDF